ncbi:DUF6053 domain-containing protein [Lysobacter capsici]
MGRAGYAYKVAAIGAKGIGAEAPPTKTSRPRDLAESSRFDHSPPK